jgi:hypothetical protein
MQKSEIFKKSYVSDMAMALQEGWASWEPARNKNERRDGVRDDCSPWTTTPHADTGR